MSRTLPSMAPEPSGVPPATAPIRLRLDAAALGANWTALARMSGRAACGAAVKADGYGLGAAAVTARLLAAGCRDFFVASWAEAASIDRQVAAAGGAVSVLHGVRAEDMGVARAMAARPVLSTAEQARRWRDAGGGACDVMVDTGFNRLGISAAEIADGLLDGIATDTLMSHLACADEASPMNERQRRAFAALSGRVPARRYSLANSAGIALGPAYHFDLTRPGIALYGGEPRAEFAGVIAPVVFPEAQVLQRRTVPAGGTVGYNATWTAPAATEVAILNIGYADGYPRALSSRGRAVRDGAYLPVIGRVSMDLLAVDVSTAAHVREGDWLGLDFRLPEASRLADRSQYELLTGLGHRFQRLWSD